MTNAWKFKTAIGTMAVAWRGERIVAIQLPEESDEALLLSVRRKVRTTSLQWDKTAPAFVRAAADAIEAHLDGRSRRFSLRSFNLDGIAPFFRKVYERAAKIPPGKIMTYAELAEAAGSPKASRAVGQAMARNPFPIVVPCHRVVGAGKSAGGFSAHGGLATKARILAIEAPGRRFFDVDRDQP